MPVPELTREEFLEQYEQRRTKRNRDSENIFDLSSTRTRPI